MIILVSLLGVILLVVVAAILGLQIDASRFSTPDVASQDLGTQPIPQDLPEPVQKFLQAVYGKQVPVVRSAIVQGTADLRLRGIRFPARFRFAYEAGQSYYHRIELTWLRIPIIKVNERYQNGVMVMELPGERIEDDPQTNSAAHQALWAEMMAWLPACLLDERLSWEAVNDTTVRLHMPDDPEPLVAEFAASTGFLERMSTLRYQDPGDDQRHRWTNRALLWAADNSYPRADTTTTQWDDEAPWAVWRVDDVLLNVDVGDYFGTG